MPATSPQPLPALHQLRHRCVEWVRLTTNTGKTLVAGNAASTRTTTTSRPAASSGRLLALRAATDQPTSSRKANLARIQFAWGTRNCTTAAAGAKTPAAATPKSPAPSTSKTPSGTKATTKSSPASSPRPSTTTKPKPAASATSVVPQITCPANANMCVEDATMIDLAYCPFMPPWTRSRCVGGCCVSTGKCASSSCSISGLGRDVPDIICYGVNNGVAIGGSNVCAGLGCRLAAPGCTTDTFGGNCVGTVWPINGTATGLSSKAKKWLGYPCLDATPSSNTLTADGKPTTSATGVYMAKLWTICNCTDVPAAGSIQEALSVPSIKQVGGGGRGGVCLGTQSSSDI